MLFRFSYVWRLRFTARQPQQTSVFRQIVEIEAERGELVTAFRRDLVHRPTRLPGPVDAEFFDETGEGAGAFVFDQVGQRAGRVVSVIVMMARPVRRFRCRKPDQGR